MAGRRGDNRRFEPDVLTAVGRCRREIPGGRFWGPACCLLNVQRLWLFDAVAVASHARAVTRRRASTRES
jgi:hypothetical protein